MPTETLRLCYRVTEVPKYSHFRLYIDQPIWGPSGGNPVGYCEWDEFGIGWGDNAVAYGPSYWTVDNVVITSGSLFAGRPWNNLFSETWGTETSKCDYGNYGGGYVDFHKADNVKIAPNKIGLYASNNQGSYQNSTPSAFRLYGLNENNEYELIKSIDASSVNKGNTALTTVTFDNTVVTSSHNLVLPDRSKGLCYVNVIPDYTVLYSRVEQFSRGTYPGGTIPWSDHNVILFKFNGWITGSDARISLSTNPPNDSWRVGIRRNDSKFGSGYFAVERGGWFSGVTIDDSSVVASSAWGGGVVFYTIPATTSSSSNEFRIIIDRLNNTIYLYLNGVLKFHQTGFSDYQSKVYLYPEATNTFMSNAYIVGCNSLQDAVAYNP